MTKKTQPRKGKKSTRIPINLSVLNWGSHAPLRPETWLDRLRFSMPNSPSVVTENPRERINQAIDDPTKHAWSQEGESKIGEVIEILIKLVSEEKCATLQRLNGIDPPSGESSDSDSPPPPPPSGNGITIPSK